MKFVDFAQNLGPGYRLWFDKLTTGRRNDVLFIFVYPEQALNRVQGKNALLLRACFPDGPFLFMRMTFAKPVTAAFSGI
ncbi:MAG: hypothetical protein JXA71_04795 [Chitinispirillaceae bacterium]|nr:hypothetical protein [Chitinispirillaceae bacterium]